MILDFAIIIFITRYLKKNLQAAGKQSAWNKILDIIFIAALVSLVVSMVFRNAAPAMVWLAHGLLLYLFYILFH